MSENALRSDGTTLQLLELGSENARLLGEVEMLRAQNAMMQVSRSAVIDGLRDDMVVLRDNILSYQREVKALEGQRDAALEASAHLAEKNRRLRGKLDTLRGKLEAGIDLIYDDGQDFATWEAWFHERIAEIDQ